jgi:hypothetical protein
VVSASTIEEGDNAKSLSPKNTGNGTRTRTVAITSGF